MPKAGPTCSPASTGASTNPNRSFAKFTSIMSIRTGDSPGNKGECLKATLLFLLGSLVGETGEAFASPADDAATAGLLGTYECSTGATAVVVPAKPVHVDQYEKSNPLLRLTIASTSRVDVLWWNKDKQDWKDDPSTDLKVKQIDVKEK